MRVWWLGTTRAFPSGGTSEGSPRYRHGEMVTQNAAAKVEDDRKLVFRVPEQLHAAIQERAKDEDRSMASWIRRALEAAIDAGKPAQT